MTVRKRIRVYGIVQGVGFRPFVDRIAARAGIAGSVCNKGPYVEIFAEGTPEKVNTFSGLLSSEAPERSSILKVEQSDVPVSGDTKFSIVHSEKVRGDIFVSPDIATCPKCRAELFDPKDRRYLHPFINCTACGPRVTILDSMPYDRERTSMKEFPMCPPCEYEYTHPETRRYHAQPVCCNDCGPTLYVPGTDLRGTEALLKTREVIRNGGIATIKGIGGFHLCCDAANEEAVARLRTLKNRPFKPFAVMLKDLATVRRECVVEDGQAPLLDGPQKPILLLRRKASAEAKLCAAVAPDNPNIGVMLPYAPVQMLLFDYPDGEPMTDCFVMTSGNPRGAPICRSDEEAVPVLGPMCDIILSNDRKIRLRADDSVMAWQDGKPYMIRRSRGYAPLPFLLSEEQQLQGSVLAAGGELKNTFCLAKDALFYPSPYIGDMADLRSVEALKQAIARMERLLEITPEVTVCDLHPKYNSSAVAKELAAERGQPVLELQHHYAHVLSCMAENDFFEPVIGVSFDGTGYGTDGTIWGGEFLLSDLGGFRRAGSIGAFPQAGGDASAREGWRIAVALLRQACASPEEADRAVLDLGMADETQLAFQTMMIENNVNCVTSTSAGRLFDAVSSLLGFRNASTCEGEASMVLQFQAEAWRDRQQNSETNGFAGSDPATRTGALDLRPVFQAEDFFQIPEDGLIRELLNFRRNHEDPQMLAALFHEAVADMVLEGCKACREMSGRNTVVLSGGVMQNLLLVELCRTRLAAEGFQLLTHSLTAPNDGGIGLGQALYGMHWLKTQH